MYTKRAPVPACWLCSLLALVAVSSLVFFAVRWIESPMTCIHVSSSQLAAVLGRNATEFAGPGPLHMTEALTNRNYFEEHARLLAGQKVYHLLTTNASLAELAIGFGHFANCKVLVPGEPGEALVGHFGAFDSGLYATRRQAAQAIEKLLSSSGWHVARLVDGKAVFVSEPEYRCLVDGKPAFATPPTMTEPSKSVRSSPGKGGVGMRTSYE